MRQDLSLGLELTVQADCSACARKQTWLASPGLLYMGSGDSHSDLHAGTAGTQPTEPAPQPPESNILISESFQTGEDVVVLRWF